MTEARHHARRHMADIAVDIGLDGPIVLGIADGVRPFVTKEPNKRCKNLCFSFARTRLTERYRALALYESEQQSRPAILRVVHHDAERVVIGRNLTVEAFLPPERFIVSDRDL